MAQYIECEVDTRPMADSLDNVSRKVNDTTKAVISMKAAVVAADAEASERVCSNVNKGFYTLMKSQLSQKIAQLQSSVDSHLLRLNQQTKMLKSIRTHMQNDYNRTSSRYVKLFDVLNKELKIRVQELDQPIFKFATTEVQTTNNRMTRLVGTFPTMQGEAVTEAQRILASNIKYRSSQVLEASSTFVDGMLRQKMLTDKIMLRSVDSCNAELYAPVVIAESCSDNNTSISVYAPQELLGNNGNASVNNEVFSNVSNLPWKDASMSDMVRNEFARLMAESYLPERVKNTISKLTQSISYQTI